MQRNEDTRGETMNVQQIQIFKDQALTDMLNAVGLGIAQIDYYQQAIYLRQTPEQEFLVSLGKLLDVMREIPSPELAEIVEDSLPCRIEVRKLLSICQSLLEPDASSSS